jgi:hypothetical protein
MIGLAMDRPIPYSQLRPVELMKLYNERASLLGEPPMKRPLELARMVEKLAILRTRKTPPIQLPPKVQKKLRAPRSAPIRDAVVKALCEVVCYIDLETGEKIAPVNVTRYAGRKLVSVGRAYSEICKKLKRRFPKSRMSVEFIMVETSNFRRRATGYEHYEGRLPDRRPPYLGIQGIVDRGRRHKLKKVAMQEFGMKDTPVPNAGA